MAVTRSTPADRRRQPTAATATLPRTGLPWESPQVTRTKEAVLLAGAFLAVLVGLFLVYRAATLPFAEVEAQMERGEVVNLNEVTRAEQIAPLLSFLEERTERAFVAEEIARHLTRPGEPPVPNVGELGKIRIPVSEVGDSTRLPELRGRLEAARAAGAAPETIRLLSTTDLRRLKPEVIVRTPAQFRRTFLLWSALFLLVFPLVHLGFRFRRFTGDELMLPIVLLLAGLGLMVMLSVRDPLRDQLLFRTFVQGVAAGAALLFAASQVDYEKSPLPRFSFVPLLAAFGLSLLLITLGSGPGGSDAKVNLFGFQPVELIKILIVLFLAGYFRDRWEFLRELPETRGGLGGMPRWARLPKLEYALPPIVAIGFVLGFFFLQKDLGPALVMAFVFFFLYAVARGRWTLAGAGAALVGLGFFAGYQLGYPRTVSGRISMWLSPWDNVFRGGDHLAQALWTLAGGGLTGTGLGLGQPGFVPEIHTDMVLAAIGEELGFLGLLGVFGLYAVLLSRGFRAAQRSGRAYSFFLALGLTLVLGLPVLLIAGGVVGLFPLSGVVSPFLSYGRSAMLANFAIVGVLLALSARGSAAGKNDAIARLKGPLRGLALGIGVVMIAILARAAHVQILRDEKVLTRGALTIQGDGTRRYQYNPRLEEIARSIPRGAIVDRNGIPLATSDPADLEEHRTALVRLGAALPSGTRKGQRIYPFGGRTFHLLGDLRSRTNWGAKNTSYAERDSRIKLQGYDDFAGIAEVTQPDGRKTREIQLDYRELLPLLRHRHEPGNKEVRAILDRDRTLRLSVDIRLQLRAAEVLERYVKEAKSPGGAAVLLDPANGDLLASVSYPWPKRFPIHPGEDEEEHRSELTDRARYGIYPPGSTFKLVTAMTALRQDPGIARKTYLCQLLPDGRVGAKVRGWGRPIRDDLTVHTPHGTVDMQKGISRSCNAYFAQLAVYDVGHEPLLEMAQKLGISVAQPNTPEQLKDALPQASYGQGQVTATPFQMTRVAATLAAGGRMPEGRWILDESNPRKAEPEPILDEALAKVVTRAMRAVVSEGTAAAYVGGVEPPMAGKTGTAEVQGKPSHSWFVGFAPYPARGRGLAFGVIVENGGYGGRVAARAAGEMVREAGRLGLIQSAGEEAR
jgi:cell division protein FtsW (lipid II flippase)